MCVLDRFDALILKIIFLKWKNIILIYFSMKNILKNNRNHTFKYTLNLILEEQKQVIPVKKTGEEEEEETQ